MTLPESLDRADHALNEVCDATEVDWVIVDNKTQLLLEYFSTALEHQAAIILLVRNNLRGSALALVRSVFEIVYRSLWVQFCATSEQADKIKKGPFDFPFMGQMVSEVDKTLATSFFSEIKRLSWGIQNDFTHTGRLQRIGRVAGTGGQHIDYPDKGMILQIDCVAQVVVIYSIVLAKSHGHDAAGERLDKLAASFT